MRRYILATCALCCLANLAEAQTPQVNYYKNAAGQTIREVSRTVRQPVSRTRTEQRQEVVHRERFVTEYRDVPRTYHTPVTEYQWEPRVHNWWNPFGQPYVAYHQVPRTRWVRQTRTDRVPVTRREVTSTERTVNVPVKEYGFENREVIERVVIHTPPRVPQSQYAGRAQRPTATIARRDDIGGREKMNGPYPRRGQALQAGSPTIVR